MLAQRMVGRRTPKPFNVKTRPPTRAALSFALAGRPGRGGTLTASTIPPNTRLAQLIAATLGDADRGSPQRPRPNIFEPRLYLCCICDRLAAPWSPYFCCRHWPSGESDNPWERPFNELFTEGEARFLWPIFKLALNGPDVPIPPFPLDRPAPFKSGGRSVFEKLHQVNLAEWAALYTTLRSVGPGRWKGLCPVHQEKTASFYVYADPWRWRCFGACAMGGDIVTLAQHVLHLANPQQAVHTLAKTYGISSPKARLSRRSHLPRKIKVEVRG